MTLSLSELSQVGVLTDPATFAEYLTFTLHQDISDDAVFDALAQLDAIENSILQKDLTSKLSLSWGVSESAWPLVFPQLEKPELLKKFPEMKDGERCFPSTDGDIFIILKSERMDLNYQAAKYIANALAPVANLIEDIQGFKYLDNRDLIDFVDGTENPKNEARIESVVVDKEDSVAFGGSYLTVQRYVDRQSIWDKQSTSYQEQVIGRTKMDNIELSDDAKPVWAHNAKSKVIINDTEVKMLRQNRPYGNAMSHGTMFIGFAKSPEVIEISLKQMIFADDAGHYDRLLDFVVAETGANYFMPSKALLVRFAD